MTARSALGDERGSTLVLALITVVAFSMVAVATSRDAMANLADTVVTRDRTAALAADVTVTCVELDPVAAGAGRSILVTSTAQVRPDEPRRGPVRRVQAIARVGTPVPGGLTPVAITSWVTEVP